MYHIVDGDSLGQFGVRRTGEIYVNDELDRETREIYELSVLVTDGVCVATARVTIVILDANDNKPICDQVSFVA